ncbi:hypothetical protein P5V93_21225, partial [Mycobacteroides abscessus subsp. abscessus]|nr:hypothetical protein [Mycobacteroides abscessus subsp. abscessus]
MGSQVLVVGMGLVFPLLQPCFEKGPRLGLPEASQYIRDLTVGLPVGVFQILSYAMELSRLMVHLLRWYPQNS